MDTTAKSADESAEGLAKILLKLAADINAAVSYQHVLDAVAPVLPDCQGVVLGLWQHRDFDRADYIEIAAAASLTGQLRQKVGQRFAKSDFPFAKESRDERLVVVEDVLADPRMDVTSCANHEALGTRAYVRVAFHREGRLIGALFFRYTHPRRFTEQERQLALGIGDLVIAAVERIQSQQETAAAVEAQGKALLAEQQAREEISLLYQASEAVNAATTFPEVIRAISPLAHQIETVNLILWEHLDYRKASYFEVVAGINQQGLPTAGVGKRYAEAQFPISSRMAKLRQLAIEDIRHHPLVDPITRAGWEADGVGALLMVSLVQDDRWYGVLSFESKTPRQYSERDRRLTLAISDLVLSAIIRIQAQHELATLVEAHRTAFLAEQTLSHEIALLYQVSKAVNQATSMTEVLFAVKQLFPDPVDVAIFAWEHYDRDQATYLETIVSTDPKLPPGTRLPREIVTGSSLLDPTQLLVANNISSPEWAAHPATDSARLFGLYSIVYTNLMHSQRVHGLVAIASYEPYTFSAQEVRLVSAIADLTSAALERFRSRRAEEEARQEREVLLQASRAINAASSFQEILDAVAHIAFDDGDFYLYVFENFDYRRATYIETVATGDNRFMREGMRIPLEALPFLKDHPRPGLAAYEDVPNHPELDPVTKATMLKQGVMSNLRFGLVWHNRILGAFGIDHAIPKRYSDREKRIVSALGELISAAVERVRLQGESHTARQRAERLAEQAQQLAALEERTRLARELHDSVSQALYGIGLGAQSAQRFLDTNPQLARDAIAYIVTLAEAGLAEMRALIFELRPESLETEGLVIALAKQGASLQARHQIDVHLELGNEPALTLAAKESLYRVLREALHNVIKHAQASQVILRMQEGDDLLFEVIDNGVGFEVVQEFPGHLGLQSMRERIHQLGGQIVIQSAPGQGTRLTIRLPR